MTPSVPPAYYSVAPVATELERPQLAAVNHVVDRLGGDVPAFGERGRIVGADVTAIEGGWQLAEVTS